MSKDNLFDEGDPFDHPAWKEAEKPKHKANKKHQTGGFVGCPMPLLKRVLSYTRSGSQLAVFLLLYRQWVLCGRRREFAFPNASLKELGICRLAKYRALTGFEQAGLIVVERHNGRAVKVERHW